MSPVCEFTSEVAARLTYVFDHTNTKLTLSTPSRAQNGFAVFSFDSLDPCGRVLHDMGQLVGLAQSIDHLFDSIDQIGMS